MRTVIGVALFLFAASASADLTYEQAVEVAKADHAAVVAKHCAPLNAKPAKDACRAEANKTLAEVIKELKKKYGK